MTWLRWAAALHGYLAVLAVAALLHPAIVLRNGRVLSRSTRWSVAASTLLVAGTYGAGLLLYGGYREHVKRALFTQSLRAGLLFETKEHLALVALCFALGGCLAALAAPSRSVAIRRTAALLYALSAMTTLLLVILGTYVSAIRGF